MKLDIVLDIQKAYRKAIQAFSYPGQIYSLEEEANKLDINIGFYKATQIFMNMFLDADTTFYVNSKELKVKIQQLTYSVSESVELAKFIFVNYEDKDNLNKYIINSSEGDLENPHLNAIIIVECEEISNDKIFQLQGCGIKESNFVGMDLGKTWVEDREIKNKQFPLGIDMIIVDKKSNFIALPRTTQIERL